MRLIIRHFFVVGFFDLWEEESKLMVEAWSWTVIVHWVKLFI